MTWLTWFKDRVAQADLVNLGVIAVFGLLLGAGGLAAMNNGVDEAPSPGPTDEGSEPGEDDSEDDDSKDNGGKGKHHDDDDDD